MASWGKKKKRGKTKVDKAEPNTQPTIENKVTDAYAERGATQILAPILAPTSFDKYDIHPTAGDSSTVIGYLETKINYSSCVADDAVRYAAFVQTVDVLIQGIADQIRITGSIIGTIKRLLAEFTEDKDIASQPLLKLEDLYHDIQKCSVVFKNIIEDIYGIVRDLPSPARGKLTRKRMSLKAVAKAHLEARIQKAGGMIHVYQWGLSIQFHTFNIRLSNRNTSEIRDMLANLIWGKSNNGPDGVIANENGPIHFGYHPHYEGWEILEFNTNHATRSNPPRPTWEVPNIPVPFSNEDLFLHAVGLRAKYVEEHRTLQEVYESLEHLPRKAVIKLIQNRNQVMRQAKSPLKWTLAGLQPKSYRVKATGLKMRLIFVILKTEWSLPTHPPPNAIPGPESEHNVAEHPVPATHNTSHRGGPSRADSNSGDGVVRENHGPQDIVDDMPPFRMPPKQPETPPVAAINPAVDQFPAPDRRGYASSSREDNVSERTEVEDDILPRHQHRSAVQPPLLVQPNLERPVEEVRAPPREPDHPPPPHILGDRHYEVYMEEDWDDDEERIQIRRPPPPVGVYREAEDEERYIERLPALHREREREIYGTHAPPPVEIYREEEDYMRRPPVGVYHERGREGYRIPDYRERENHIRHPPPLAGMYREREDYMRHPPPLVGLYREREREREDHRIPEYHEQERAHMAYQPPPPPPMRRRAYVTIRERLAQDPIRRDPEYVHVWKDRDRRLWEEVYLGRAQGPNLSVDEQDMIIDGLASQWDEMMDCPPKSLKKKPKATSSSTSTWRNKRSKGFVFVRHSATRAKIERL